MPNHVSNNVYISGPASSLTELKTLLKIQEGSEVDFNGIIPMPEAFNNIESVSTGHLAAALLALPPENLICLHTREVHQTVMRSLQEHFAKICDWEQVTVAQVVAELDANPKLAELCCMDLALGRIYLNNKRRYGGETWYEWRVQNWGTKWNAYHTEIQTENDTEIVVLFDTAWSLAEPVYEAIAERFPELYINVQYIDEGGGFAGELVLSGGQYTDYPCSDEDFKAFATEHFGWSFDDDSDDE